MTHAVEIENLGKRYELGEPGRLTLREALLSLGRRSTAGRDSLWALRDVDLTIDVGEVLGVVGRNGAGKSTLLKILSRITAPTTGRARTRGRVGALLEVGTGFHPELTGRENVALNGAILGMRRQDVARRFDQIVEFAGLERFIDTPVKRYSSGMRLRLAFSVAAHLEPEIVVVDEVLAVGDAEFQRKCLGRMSELTHEGRTVIFVSHDHGALARLCTRAIWLERGRIEDDGTPDQVIESYLRSAGAGGLVTPLEIRASGPVEILAVAARTIGGDRRLIRGAPLEFTVRFRLRDTAPGLDVGFYLKAEAGTWVLNEAAADRGEPLVPAGAPGVYEATMSVPAVLPAGRYTLALWMGSSYDTYVDDDALLFELEPRLDDRAEAVARPRTTQPSVTWSSRVLEPGGTV